MSHISDDDLAQLIGPTWKSQKAAWQDKDNPRLPRIDQALTLDLAYVAAGGNSLPFFSAFEMAVSGQNSRSACLIAAMAALATLSKDTGEAVSAVIHALRPNAPPRDIQIALVELQDVDIGVGDMTQRLKTIQNSLCNAGLGAINAGGIQ
jgi:hypothetical protein